MALKKSPFQQENRIRAISSIESIPFHKQGIIIDLLLIELNNFVYNVGLMADTDCISGMQISATEVPR